MESKLQGKVALITGAGKKRGIGFACAKALAAEGCHVVLADLSVEQSNDGLSTGNMENLKKLSQELSQNYGVRVLPLGLDVTSTASCREAAEFVKKEFGVLHVLHNNAGISLGGGVAIHEYDENAWLKNIDVNLTGVFRVSKAFIPLMSEGGSIINTSSRAGKVPGLGIGSYSVTKAALIMMTKCMAKELAQANIRVNAICPGQIKTDMETYRFEREAAHYGTSPEIQIEAMCKTIPLGRIGEMEEVGKVVVFLAGDTSSYMTGQALNITGGQLMEL